MVWTHHVVQAVLPQRLAREHVQLRAGRALREDGRIDSDLPHQLSARAARINNREEKRTYVALEDTRERLALLGRRPPKVHRARRVNRAVAVLPSRVTVNVHR